MPHMTSSERRLERFIRQQEQINAREFIVIRRREFVDDLTGDGYEAYLNYQFDIFGVGKSESHAIENLRLRLIFEDQLPSDFDKLDVTYRINSLPNGHNWHFD